MITLGLVLFVTTAAPGQELPPTKITYAIEVTLDPETRMLEGRETIWWTNPSDGSVETVPVHLYLNGFAHEQSSWMKSAGRRPRLGTLLRRYDDPWGWCEPRWIRQGDVELKWRPVAPDDGNPFDRSLIEVALAKPVTPGETLVLDIEFEARLPIPMARTGGYDDYFFVAQWFPKVAVFETVGVRGAVDDGWAAHQFHGPTEFYADYANFDVRIGVPKGWAVVATGRGQQGESGSDASIEWHKYQQRAVHDFAFATGATMVDVTSTHLAPGGPVEVHVFVPAGTEHQAGRWREAVEGSLDVLGTRVGPYPYETVTVVMPPWRGRATGGMEYPTLFTGAPGDPIWDVKPFSKLRLGELVIAHEFAHQYFYGIVGTNEFEEAFLDEGFTEHWGMQAMIGTYRDKGGGGTFLGRQLDLRRLETESLPDVDTRLPPVWSRPSFLGRGISHGTQFYTRPATTMLTAEALFGVETIDKVFAFYFRRWAFKHPRYEDFLDAAREAGGEEVAAFIHEAFTQPRLPDYRVASIDTETWSRPLGHLVTEDGVFEFDDDDDDAEFTLVGLDPAAREEDGRMMVEILDPGWTRPDHQEPGRIERRHMQPEYGEPDPEWEADDDDEDFHLSQVRIEGPGWQNLPVEVLSSLRRRRGRAGNLGRAKPLPDLSVLAAGAAVRGASRSAS